jgi:hypothetical protein
MTFLRIGFSLAVAALLFPARSNGAEIAVDLVSGGVVSTSINFNPETVGWTFTPTADLAVTRLGYWDEIAEDSAGLADPRTVTLWDPSDTVTPLATVEIDNSSEVVASADADGQWLFEDIDRVVLTKGTTYHIGGETVSGEDGFRSTGTSPLLITTANGFNYGEPVSSSAASGAAYPEITGLPFTPIGYFGPNFEFNIIPEPSTIVLCLGLCVSGLWRRRRSGLRA